MEPALVDRLTHHCRLTKLSLSWMQRRAGSLAAT